MAYERRRHLSSYWIAAIAFGCTVVGYLVGLLIQRYLPEDHLSGDSKESVKQGLGMLATLSALVLGLLVATTKGTYDAQSAAVKDLASSAMLLDRILERYGKETKETKKIKEIKDIRAIIKKGALVMVKQLWPSEGEGVQASEAELRMAGDVLFDKVSDLKPNGEAQTMLKARALELIIGIGQTRQKLLAQRASSIPLVLLVVLIVWMSLLFGCYGLLAARNWTSHIIMAICMLSLASSLLLVLELDRPFDGLIRVPSTPLTEAHSRLGE
jgi:hypothetical protein